MEDVYFTKEPDGFARIWNAGVEIECLILDERKPDLIQNRFRLSDGEDGWDLTGVMLSKNFSIVIFHLTPVEVYCEGRLKLDCDHQNLRQVDPMFQSVHEERVVRCNGHRLSYKQVKKLAERG